MVDSLTPTLDFFVKQALSLGSARMREPKLNDLLVSISVAQMFFHTAAEMNLLRLDPLSAELRQRTTQGVRRDDHIGRSLQNENIFFDWSIFSPEEVSEIQHRQHQFIDAAFDVILKPAIQCSGPDNTRQINWPHVDLKKLKRAMESPIVFLD